MASTYDSTLPSDRDKVRFLIGDTAATFQLTDDELDWILTEQSNVYLAAARALSVMLGNWAGKGRGVTEKQVDVLRLKWGTSGSDAQTIEGRIAELRQLGTPSPRALRVLV